MPPRIRKRVFYEHDRAKLLQATATFRRALIAASAEAPLNSAISKVIGEGLELTVAIGEILTGDAFHFAGRHRKEEAPQPRFPLAGNDRKTAADEAIAACGGDLRATVEALLVACDFLEAELARLSAAIPPGHERGWLSPRLR